MALKTSHEREHQILGAISAQRAERLLTYWVNLQTEWPRSENEESLKLVLKSVDEMRASFPVEFKDCPSIPTVVLREFLRKAWDASDPRQRDWFMYKFRDFYRQTILRVQEVATGTAMEMPIVVPSTRIEALEATGPRNDPPPVTPIEAAAFYFQRNSNRARRCKNPECAWPYFFVSKKGQTYCTQECATPAKREAKRRWWEQNRGRAAKRKTPKRKRT